MRGGLAVKAVFVSSTFKDMHFERDILNREIEPKLNYLLSKYNRTVRMADLRWGIDTSSLSEDEASEKVLSVCFDEIDRCQPYIIILLGDRYGYIPSGEEISVTHMEIIRGALNNSSPENVFIYMRETDYSGTPAELLPVFSDGEESSREKLRALKNELLQKFPDRCKTYSARWDTDSGCMVSDDFFETVYTDLSLSFEREYGANTYKSLLHRQAEESEETLSEAVGYAYKNTERLSADTAAALASDKPYGIVGDAGAGKSVYMSLLCSEFRARGEHAYILYCGDNAFSASCRNAAEYVLYAMTEVCGEEYDFESHADDEYDTLLGLIGKKREKMTSCVTVFFDALDKADDGMLSLLLWLTRYASGCVRAVFSSRLTDGMRAVENSFNFAEIKYAKDDFKQMTVRILQRYGKTLHESLVDSIAECADSPLKLSLLTVRLLSLGKGDYDKIAKLGGGIDAINAYMSLQIDCAASVDTDTLAGALIMSLLDSSSNPSFSSLLLNLIAFSEYGLPISDLKQLTETVIPWVELDFIDFMSRFGFFIRTSENGRLDVSHDIIRAHIRSVIDGDYAKRLYGILAMFYNRVENETEFTVRTYFDSVYKANMPRLLSGYLNRHTELYERVPSKEAALIKEEIRNSICRLFYLDRGRFLFDTINGGEDYNESILSYSLISTSLCSAKNYLSPENALAIADLVMSLPLQLCGNAQEILIAESALRDCRLLFEKHCVGGEGDGFIEGCARTIEQKKAELEISQKSESPLDEIMQKLISDNVSDVEKMNLLARLFDISESMAKNKETARTAANICEFILANAARFLSGELLEMSAAKQYKTLSHIYKTLESWEKSFEYANAGVEFCKKLHESKQSKDTFNMYRGSIHNMADIALMRAYAEKDELSLWENACDCFEQLYRLDMLAIGHGLEAQGVLSCSNSILTYATVLLKLGRYDESLEKYGEAIAMAADVAANNQVSGVCEKLCASVTEAIYQLMLAKKYEIADRFTPKLAYCVAQTVNGEDERFIAPLKNMLVQVSNFISDIVGTLVKSDRYDELVAACRLSCNVYIAYMPVASSKVKRDILLMQKIIGDVHFLVKQDYKTAYEEYIGLFELAEKYALTAPDESGRYNESSNIRLLEAFIRIIVCLYAIEEDEKIHKLSESLERFVRFIVSCTYSYSDDPLEIVLLIAKELTKYSSSLAQFILAHGIAMVRRNASYREGAGEQTYSNICQMYNILANEGRDNRQ